MNMRRRAVAIVLPVVLVLVLGLLFNRTTAVDLGTQNRVMLNLRELEKLDAEWNVNILRARIGQGTGYQALAAPLPRIHLLRVSVHEALALTQGPVAPQAFEQLSAALREKARLVEQFKAGNAVLREALVDLPPAVTDLKTELNGIEGALVPARTLLALDGALNALLTDILRFNLAPDVVLARRIETTLGTMLVQKAAFSPAVGERIDLLLRDARAVLRYRPLENAIEIEIGGVGTAESIERLGRLFDKAFDDVLLYQDAAQRGRADGEVMALLREGLAGASRTTRIDEIRGEFVAIDTALARLQPGDLCLILVDQVQEALAHLAERVKQAREPGLLAVA